MGTRSFGRRGMPAVAYPRPTAPARVVVEAAPASVPASPSSLTGVRERELLDHVPILTSALVLLLLLVFLAERRFAFDVFKGDVSTQSLVAMGAISRDLVVGSSEWWRVALAPLLHASTSHITGNCFALFVIGYRLEPLIGRGWLAVVFALSALGGVAGSLFGNAPHVPSVGASGAITGLIAALFVVSFQSHGEPEEQRAHRVMALRFGVPALAPLAFGASGHTDYFAHAGGALAGAVLAVILGLLWRERGQRPPLRMEAALVGLMCLVLSVVAATFARRGFPAHAAVAAQRAPASLLAGAEKLSLAAADDIATRFPNDPRAQLVRALTLAKAGKLTSAETALRRILAGDLSKPDQRPIAESASTVLALTLVEQRRLRDAQAVARPLCGTLPPRGANKKMLDTARLCQ